MSSCSSSSFSLLKPLTFPSTPCPSPALLFHNNPIYIPFKTTSNHSKTLHLSKRLTIPFALTESDSPKSLQPDLQTLLQQLADSFDLPSDYFSQLPNDLRLDLNDAAFDLSNGPVIDECGMELGKTLLNLSRAWESADTSTSYALASKVPLLANSLTDSAKSAFGRRLVAAGRRFQAMGQYGQGELQKIAKAMNAAGKLLSASSMSATTEEQPKTETRMFKFGELQVEVTSEKANIGAAIGFVFGNLSWQIAQGIQSIPESSLEYANDNALLLAKTTKVRGKVTFFKLSCTNFTCELARLDNELPPGIMASRIRKAAIRPVLQNYQIPTCC
ncbi:Replicative DNA helicase [Gossypium arboreum]|uniref:Replicative DNA helicase n=1 Tax=Gossypium arboreum TaxID=29729 RepID=A0A0B0MST5_GOSAR|nr:Replicative DNA helicase [Gossypium arboreum]